MKRLSVMAMLAAGFLLAACAGGAPDVGGLDIAEIGAAAEADKGATQKMADELLGIASTPEARGVRLCMVEAAIVEVMTYRVAKFDPDYAATALGQIALLDGILDRFDPDSVFPDTEMALAMLQIDRVLIEVGKDRVPRLLASLAGGVNVLGVLDRARVAAAQGRLLAALVRDTRALIAAVEGGRIAPADGMQACRDRIAMNSDRIFAVLGGVPVAAAPPG